MLDHLKPPLPQFTRTEQTCYGCPSQWDAWDADGNQYYLRFRWGVGTLTRRYADAIVPVTDEPYKGYEIIATVQKIIDAHPGHTFSGQFDCEGEEAGDLWRLVVRDGRAAKVEPQIVWPEGSE